MEIIKQCPFCGEESECHDSGGDSWPEDTTYSVSCGTDFCYGNAAVLDCKFNSPHDAIIAWNRRI